MPLSLLVKWTVPVYALATLLNGSSAVSVMVNAAPAVASRVAEVLPERAATLDADLAAKLASGERPRL